MCLVYVFDTDHVRFYVVQDMLSLMMDDEKMSTALYFLI